MEKKYFINRKLLKLKCYYIYTMDKIVKIDNEIKVILIPERKEYFDADLSDKLWYNDDEFYEMKKIRDSEIKALTYIFHGNKVKAINQWKKNIQKNFF